LKLTYEEVHGFPELILLEQRAKLGCTFCSLLRSTIRDNATQWFDLPASKLLPCEITLHHLEIFLDRATTHEPGGTHYASGRCIAFVEFPRHFMEALKRGNAIEQLDFSVLLNHGS
jgi:hypothetical protein